MVGLLLLCTLSRSPQLPSVEALAARLAAGRLVLDQAPFAPGGDTLAGGSGHILRQAARALNLTTGRFAVLVPPEREASLPPDTVLSRRRAQAAFRALLAAGANPGHLVAPPVRPHGTHASDPVPAKAARIELIRVDPPAPAPKPKQGPAL